ncbi:SNF2-related protein [Desulforhabdus sp. TSK]|uniref:SNF2-related protein n=1 Tax=Desulforhabdus sp. TSK TaxID=2925014 RepID=UPI001FC872E0|nr:SNF2-related protein [Desulforhabdus sp. TSK]GKT10089.1 helicase [Desulforhabdus sp. TSK]
MTCPFLVGNKVRCRNQIWEVGKIDENKDGTWTLRLYPEAEGKPRSFLYPLTPVEPVGSAFDHLAEGRIDHIDHYRLYTNATRLSLVYEYDKLLSISNSKMIPEPYQLLAVKKVMESLRQRHLIADDVGLGKTIEAGLIMQELTARQRGNRILIVVPASLQDQWKKEMQRHFLRTFYIYNSRKMEGIQELVDENLNPWLAKNSIITSIDWVKPQYDGTGASRRNTNLIFDQLMKVEKQWDLVIIDEAHYVSTDSNRAEFGTAIQEKTDSLLLLTATPHSGNTEHFFNLLHLLDPFMFATPEDLDRSDALERVDKVMIRRGKETIYELSGGQLIKKFKDREPHPIEIEFSEAEQEIYDTVSEYTASGWAQLTRKRKISATERNIGKFLFTLVQKRMVSSLYALRETLKRRIGSIVEARTVTKINGTNIRQINNLVKDYEKGTFLEDEDRELVERYIETRRVEGMYAERTNEVKTLRSLLEQAEILIGSEQDSKLEWLKEFLKELFARDPQEKVIIFTEYRDTLEYLKSKIEKLWFLGKDSIVVIHGGMPLGENEQEVDSKLYAESRFNDPDTRILLATDAASEGLNLQRYCHILVNYELPWNPNRLEQRIGRIHRYGQKRIASIYNLLIKGSKEAEIFKRLQEKIEIIRKQLGNMAEVLGVLERVSLDDLILRVLDRSLGEEDVSSIAEQELKKMEDMAAKLRETQFLSGCRQFTREDILAAEGSIKDSQEAIPQYVDVQAFVETFLRVYGDPGSSERDGTKLHPTKHKEVYRLLVPSVIQDDKISRIYSRITFQRSIATRDWPRGHEPDFLAFGHPLLDRMVHYCRETKAAELGSKLTCLVADYVGLPGVILNYLLRFEDRVGRVIREELEPVFVDIEGQIHPELGRKLFLGPSVPKCEPNLTTLDLVREKIADLRDCAENYTRAQYQEYYQRVEKKRDEEIAILLDDLERFDKGIMEHLQKRLLEIRGGQMRMFEDPATKGQRTKLENQLKMHQHRMLERRTEVENMRLGAFPAPEPLNMVIVSTA